MACGFCAATLIAVCPMCSGNAVSINAVNVPMRKARKAPRPTQAPRVGQMLGGVVKVVQAVCYGSLSGGRSCVLDLGHLGPCSNPHPGASNAGAPFPKPDPAAMYRETRADVLQRLGKHAHSDAVISQSDQDALGISRRDNETVGEALRRALPDPTPPPPRLTVDQAIREAYDRGQFNVAVGLLIGLTGGPLKVSRIELMTAIDAAAKTRGYLTERCKAARKAIAEDCIAELGYNPRVENGPKVETRVERAPPLIVGPAPKQLPAPISPLVGGDWAELFRRVQRGEISHNDAVEIGQIWRGMKGEA